MINNEKKSIFNASFEESINLENDGFRKLQQEQHDKIAKKVINGTPTFVFKIQAAILTLLFPVCFNYLLSLASTELTNYQSNGLDFQPSNYNFLTWQVYLILLCLWLLLVIVGKHFNQAFVLPYRYQFHTFTYMIILYIEIDLLIIGLLLSNLPFFIVLAIMMIWIILIYFMVAVELRGIRKIMYNESNEPRKIDKIAKLISMYGMGILGVAVIVKRLVSMFLGETSNSLEEIGILLAVIIINIITPAVVIFIGTPYFLHAYYKLKYSELYRKYEGKSVEEWYGKKYLKKHKELTENE